MHIGRTEDRAVERGDGWGACWVEFGRELHHSIRRLVGNDIAFLCHHRAPAHITLFLLLHSWKGMAESDCR